MSAQDDEALPEGQSDADETPSKSQRKRDAQATFAFARRLLDTPASKLRRLPLSAEVKQALETGARISSFGARKRHTQYLAGLLRQVDDLSQLQELLDNPPSAARTPAKLPHSELCERLIADLSGAADELRRDFPSLEIQHVRQLIRQIGKPQTATAARSQLSRLLAEHHAPPGTD